MMAGANTPVGVISRGRDLPRATWAKRLRKPFEAPSGILESASTDAFGAKSAFACLFFHRRDKSLDQGFRGRSSLRQIS